MDEVSENVLLLVALFFQKFRTDKEKLFKRFFRIFENESFYCRTSFLNNSFGFELLNVGLSLFLYERFPEIMNPKMQLFFESPENLMSRRWDRILVGIE
jgi:hypothetical protein